MRTFQGSSRHQGLVLALLYFLGNKVELSFQKEPKKGDKDSKVNTSFPNMTDSTSNKASNITVGAYYYPWHTNDFHNGQVYLRGQLEPPQPPAMGEYDDSDKATIATHLGYADLGNMKLWVTSWWGPEHTTDVTTTDTVMKQVEMQQSSLQLAIFYESTNRLRVNGEWKLDYDKVSNDMKHLSKEYFEHFDNYYMIDGKPVIFIYLTRVLQRYGGDATLGLSLLHEVVALMRSTATMPLYIVGDHAFDPYPIDLNSNVTAAHNASMKILDAITNYNVYGSIIGRSTDMYATQGRINQYYERQAVWKRMAAEHDCAYIASVTPGFNNRGGGGTRFANFTPLSRRTNATDPEGSFFQATLKKARALVDPKADNLLVVTTFNEWHEDTQIEPTFMTVATTEPLNLTNGLKYPGYGNLYLDILRKETI